MPFIVPQDSLSRRYNQAYRLFTWEGIRGPSGDKILPKIRKQIQHALIYNAVCTWMETQLRLIGITCTLSALDLQKNVEALDNTETDRTMKCIKVIKTLGICSEDDFKCQNPNATAYRLNNHTCFFGLHEQQFNAAVEAMQKVPLLVVFSVGSNYKEYVETFGQKPVLSYVKYEEGKMSGHGACAMGYGTESIVPFWKFMNSYGNIPSTKGFGRLLPQNAIYLIAPKGGLTVLQRPAAGAQPTPPAMPLAAVVALPAAPAAPPAAAPGLKKRSWDDFMDGENDLELPPSKKQKQQHHVYMDQDYVLPHLH
ncbi:hypothetical protein ACP70R_005136 [Stipagrostis hirtigluma subsp. patula]